MNKAQAKRKAEKALRRKRRDRNRATPGERWVELQAEREARRAREAEFRAVADAAREHREQMARLAARLDAEEQARQRTIRHESVLESLRNAVEGDPRGYYLTEDAESWREAGIPKLAVYFDEFNRAEPFPARLPTLSIVPAWPEVLGPQPEKRRPEPRRPVAAGRHNAIWLAMMLGLGAL